MQAAVGKRLSLFMNCLEEEFSEAHIQDIE
jgi:hypothetical protein